jgi:hypothetical protein
MTKKQGRVFVARGLPTRVPELIARVRVILAMSKKVPAAKSSNPPLAKLASLVDALAKAETATLTRTRGLADKRDVVLSELRGAVGAYAGWAQEQGDADPEHAASFFESLGLYTRAPSTRKKANFTVRPGRVSGTLIAEVKAPAKRAGYDWQWSDDGGAEWHRVSGTVKAKKTLEGVPVGKYVSVRWRPVLKTGQGDWSEAITVLVK